MLDGPSWLLKAGGPARKRVTMYIQVGPFGPRAAVEDIPSRSAVVLYCSNCSPEEESLHGIISCELDPRLS